MFRKIEKKILAYLLCTTLNILLCIYGYKLYIHNHPKYDLSNSFKIRKDYKFIYLKIIRKLSTWACINTKLK